MTHLDPSPDSELSRLWAILSELSAQLSHNRQQTEELHRRAEELKVRRFPHSADCSLLSFHAGRVHVVVVSFVADGVLWVVAQAQAVHTQTGFTLRRFNVDISQEEFDSELERLNVTLVLENQSLQHENRQLSILLKDYEATLEAVMAKFRAHAYATQQHHLDLIKHYETLLLSLPASSSSPSSPLSSPMIDPLHLSLSLSHLSSLIRKALRSLNGEDPEENSNSPLLFPSGMTGPAGIAAFTEDDAATPSRPLRDESTGGYIGRYASTAPHYIPTTSTSSLIPSPPRSNTHNRSSSTSSTSTSSAIASALLAATSIDDGLRDAAEEGTASGAGTGAGAGAGAALAQTRMDALERGSASDGKSGGGGGGGGGGINALLRRPVVDDALEREIELEALRKENEELRAMLGISGMGGTEMDGRLGMGMGEEGRVEGREV